MIEVNTRLSSFFLSKAKFNFNRVPFPLYFLVKSFVKDNRLRNDYIEFDYEG